MYIDQLKSLSTVTKQSARKDCVLFGKKMKRAREESTHREEEDEDSESETDERLVSGGGGTDDVSDDDEEEDGEEGEGMFVAKTAPRLPKTLNEKVSQRRVIVVLQRAALITVKTKQVYISE